MGDWATLVGGVNAAALAAFGRPVVYRPEGGDDIPLRAIFQPTREAEETSPRVYGVIFIRLADLPEAPQRGDKVLVGDAVYTVFQIEGDGEGAVTLSLRIE